MGGFDVVLPNPGYPILRRWARHKIYVPVRIVVSKWAKNAVVQGRGSNLNCGGMTIFGIELPIGEQVIVEFLSPYSGQQRKIWAVVRDSHVNGCGIEFITQDEIG